jgi:hypothetical protein
MRNSDELRDTTRALIKFEIARIPAESETLREDRRLGLAELALQIRKSP